MKLCAFRSDLLTIALILLAHFSNFILYAGYRTLFPDIALAVLALAALAALIAWIMQTKPRLVRALLYAVLISVIIGDATFEFGVSAISARLVALSAIMIAALGLVLVLRENANRVLAAVFFTMLASTLGIGGLAQDGWADAPAVPAAPATGPITLHLVLDEHIGLTGLTEQLPGAPALRKELEEFYTSYGFRLFSRAHSQYFSTALSLSSSFNYDSGDPPEKHLTARRYGFALDRNTYLAQLTAGGHKVEIYQSNYFDLCGTTHAHCLTYRPDWLGGAAIAAMPLAERMKLLFRMYYSSVAATKLLLLAQPHANGWLDWLWHGRVGPAAVEPVWERLELDIRRAQTGNVFFAHLLAPHYPYVEEADCQLRLPSSSWLLREQTDGTNTPESRRVRYAAYFDQVRCTMAKLESLFETMHDAGVLKEATIVIHGDHGARITRIPPQVIQPTEATQDDYVDAFSTLFAIRAPGVAPGLDVRPLPLSRLMRFAATGNEAVLTPPPIPEEGVHFVPDSPALSPDLP